MKSLLRYIRLVILHLLYRCKPSLPLSDKTVIIAPHPDDEVMGCAGLIQHLVENGTPPHVIIMTGGGGSHRYCCKVSEGRIIAERRHLAFRAAALLRVPISYVHLLDYPDGGINRNHPETKNLHELLTKLSPDSVFVPH